MFISEWKVPSNHNNLNNNFNVLMINIKQWLSIKTSFMEPLLAYGTFHPFLIYTIPYQTITTSIVINITFLVSTSQSIPLLKVWFIIRAEIIKLVIRNTMLAETPNHFMGFQCARNWWSILNMTRLKQNIGFWQIQGVNLTNDICEIGKLFWRVNYNVSRQNSSKDHVLNSTSNAIHGPFPWWASL